jgi:hypothetical protein
MHTMQAVIARLESGRVKPLTLTLERLTEAMGPRPRMSFEPLNLFLPAGCAKIDFGLWRSGSVSE